MAARSGSPAFRASLERDAQRSRTRATPAGAFAAARRRFERCERLDMQALAAELAISRATLYRWTGDREQLLGDVIWSLSHELFERAKAQHPEHTGAPRVIAVFRAHLQAIVDAGS